MSNPERIDAESSVGNNLEETFIDKVSKRTRSLGRHTLTILDQGVAFINSMPFPGKLLTKQATLYAAADRNLFTKEVRLVGAFGIIGLLATANAEIGMRSIETSQKLLDNQFDHDNPIFWARLGFEVAFAAGHFACTAAQIRLMSRLTPTLVKTTKHIVAESSAWKRQASLEEDIARFADAVKTGNISRLKAFDLIKSVEEKNSIVRDALPDIRYGLLLKNYSWQYLRDNQKSRKAAAGSLIVDTLNPPERLGKVFDYKELGTSIGVSAAIYGTHIALSVW